MPPQKASIAQHFELALVKGIAGVFRTLPHRKAQALGSFLGGLLHDITGIRKEVAREQLAASFPEKDDKWVNKTVRKAYCHMVTVVAETARIPAMKGDELNKWVIFDDVEILKEVLDRGKGCLVAAAHLGCWEYQGAWAANNGFSASYVVAEQTNPAVGKYVDDIRRSIGVEIVLRSEATRGIISALKNNRLIAMMIDQDARSRGEFVPFFGRLASTFRGVAVFALKLQTPVAVLTSYRLDDGRIKCKFEIVDFTPSGDRDKDIYDLTCRLVEMIEQEVRKHPDQYLWLHKRWKTRPAYELGIRN
ncbi:MAG: lysophospholipid acyltransferase family protein [Candidatus Electryonea clarkiae]|nr:lysophospholipid acyltransferase family protein [Candidatus Electryonea clarkiae]